MAEPLVMVLGGGGMLGHRVVRTLVRAGVPVACTLRGGLDDFPEGWREILARTRLIEGVDAMRADYLARTIEEVRPTAVVNCVGVIKQRAEGADPVATIAVNALAPHLVARAVQPWGGRLIHISTDCVFEGPRGDYVESDVADARDLYGLSKALGEPKGERVLTLRTSLIGREIRHRESLMEWFIAQNHGSVRGFRRVFWSGVTNIYLAELVLDILTRNTALSGLFHLAGERVSKYNLLLEMREALGLDIEIVPDDSVVMDRSLNGAKLRAVMNRETPGLREMLDVIAADPAPYPRPS